MKLIKEKNLSFDFETANFFKMISNKLEKKSFTYTTRKPINKKKVEYLIFPLNCWKNSSTNAKVNLKDLFQKYILKEIIIIIINKTVS